MPLTKNAWIRYKALDSCLSDRRKRYTINDLVEACNKALEEFDTNTGGIQKRMVYNDLLFLESEAGYQAEIEKTKEGKWVYYRYSDPEFSILNTPLKKHEMEQLREALMLFNRISGLPQFEGLEELSMKLETGMQSASNAPKHISFEQNPYLKGLHFLQPLWDAIQHETKLKLRYQGFKQSNAIENIVYPYYLKQYNSRWFLFAWNEDSNALSNFALDRIQHYETIAGKWRPSEIDIELLLEDAVGVSIPKDMQPENVVLAVESELLPYLETKPIHGSQKIQKQADGSAIVKLNLFINFELKRLLLSFGAQVKIIEPEGLKSEILQSAQRIAGLYV